VLLNNTLSQSLEKRFENIMVELVNLALKENSVVSQELIMSPLFFQEYQTHVKDWNKVTYPIRVDETLKGYCLFAVPNEN
jgi:hypothetical protein